VNRRDELEKEAEAQAVALGHLLGQWRYDHALPGFAYNGCTRDHCRGALAIDADSHDCSITGGVVHYRCPVMR
jgi:hypothetical protein